MKQTIKIKFRNKDGNLVENNGHVAHGFIDKGTLGFLWLTIHIRII